MSRPLSALGAASLSTWARADERVPQGGQLTGELSEKATQLQIARARRSRRHRSAGVVNVLAAARRGDLQDRRAGHRRRLGGAHRLIIWR